jgi:hypothetical protein
MQISCSRAGALLYTVRTKPCRWSIDLMTTISPQEYFKKKFTSWRSSFLHLLPAQHASLDIVQNYNLGKTFSSSNGSCLHIGTQCFVECKTFYDLNCLELFSWWFWNINLHHFVHETATTLFWKTYESFLWIFFYSILSCFEDLELTLVRPAYCAGLGFLHEMVFLSESLATECTRDDRHHSSSSESCLLLAMHHILRPCAALFCYIIWI